MAQNFRRRISLLPDSFQKIQNSLKKFKEIDLSEKADSDTFNKSTIDTITPIKDKKIDPYLLETPLIDKKRLRKISIYSPLSFTENSNLNDNDCSYIQNLSTKKVTNFNNEILENNEDILFINLYFSKYGKMKKLINNENNKKAEKKIEFHDRNYKKYIFPFFDDKDIFGNDNIIKDNEMKCLNIQDDESSDEEQIQNDFNICLNQLDEAINYYSKYHDCISRNINKEK